jgi:signal transduction histidine kinase
LPPLQTSVGQSDAQANHDVERGQARQRLHMVFVVVTFLTWRYFGETEPAIPSDAMPLLFGYFGGFFIYSLLIFALVRLRPGRFAWRRLPVMAIDYFSLGFCLVVGGQAALPVFAVLVWVTVGNGMRFGPMYLAIAVAMAMATLGGVIALTPYWQANPDVAIALTTTALIVPAYASGLLRRTVQARQAADAANLAKSRFLAQASHDLRQPVHATGLFLVSLRDTPLSAVQRQIVDRIDRSLQGVSRLFQSLLDISTLDSGTLTVRPEPIALGPLLADLAQQNRQTAQWAGVDLRLVATKRHVLSDPALLTTALQNLITNALKYAPGRPVLVGVRHRAGRLSIEVHDRGPGIPGQHLPHLFDEFYRVRTIGDRDIDGVGLGLAIVRRLTDLMGLDVEIATRQGHGTSVILGGLVPCDSAPVLTARPVREMPLADLRVLLIEDDRDVLEATASLLQSWGCSVEQALTVPHDPADCDLVITDFDLGSGVTGNDAIAHVRSRLGRPVPAIVTTAHNQVRVTGLLTGPEIRVLSKPLRAADLRSAVTAARLQGVNSA